MKDVQVGKYSVVLHDKFIPDQRGENWHFLAITEWDEMKIIKQNFLYIADESYEIALKKLDKESLLQRLIGLNEFSKIKFRGFFNKRVSVVGEFE